MNKVQDLQNEISKAIASMADPDGFDMAYYQGIQHILKSFNLEEGVIDDGVEEQYLDGIKYAISKLLP